MRLSEVFATIQGEGVLSGVPSLFIRTTGCNLRCRWCDTPYTSWNPEGEDWPLDRIINWVEGFPLYRHVVVTGGEPMLPDEIGSLCRELRTSGRHITIETAGTIYRDVACDLMSISPKLANSTPDGAWAERHESLRLQGSILRRLVSEYSYQLKFVVCSPDDLAEIKAVVDSTAALPERVLLMPEGAQPEILRERARWLVEVCKQTGYRYCPRLHIELWGSRRGV